MIKPSTKHSAGKQDDVYLWETPLCCFSFNKCISYTNQWPHRIQLFLNLQACKSTDGLSWQFIKWNCSKHHNKLLRFYCSVLDIWLAGFKNVGKLFCQLIGFHCLGGPGFSKCTVTMRFIAWNLLFKKLTIRPDIRVLVSVPHPNPMKFCIILPFNYSCHWDPPIPPQCTMSVISLNGLRGYRLVIKQIIIETFQRVTERGNYGCQKYQ